MDWDTDISAEAKEVMDMFGVVGPTVDVSQRMIKGYMMCDGYSCKTYLNSDDLNRIAVCCRQVADWLDKRANNEQSI